MATENDSHENDTEKIDEVVDVDVNEKQNEGEPSSGDTELDLPGALAELETARRKIRDVNRESAGRRKEIADLKKQLETFSKSDDDAVKQLSSIQTELATAREELRLVRMRDKFDEVVGKSRIAFANLTASRDAFVFARDAMSKLPEDATEEDLLDIVQDVVKARPYLLNKPESRNINSESKGKPDILAGIDLDQISRDFGITRS